MQFLFSLKPEALCRKLKERTVKSKEQWLSVYKTKLGMQKAFKTQILHLVKKIVYFLLKYMGKILH